LVGSPGERAITVGFALPLEIGGQRRRRIELAQVELEATEAEVTDRERRLTNEVLASYAEALSSLRELQITEELNNLDNEMTRFVQIRVNEGETPPLDLNLLRVEADRLRSRRALAEGRLQAALTKLKNIAGIPPTEALRLKEDFAAPSLREPPISLDAAVEIGLRTRPDLRLARLNEEVARAGLRLARAQSAPEVTASAKYSSDRSITDLPEPLVALPDQSRALSFGVSIGLPVLNRNQGAKAEATIAITQAQRRREFAETVVRAEVTSAYARYEAARSAVNIFEQGVIGRSNDNIRTIRAAYQIGAFSITDLLVQQRQLLDSQREFTDALAERYRALADLQSATGVPVNPQP
jgi:cobalt-zinc-cadmium efflux system outer membrane protein